MHLIFWNFHVFLKGIIYYQELNTNIPKIPEF